MALRSHAVQKEHTCRLGVWVSDSDLLTAFRYSWASSLNGEICVRYKRGAVIRGRGRGRREKEEREQKLA